MFLALLGRYSVFVNTLSLLDYLDIDPLPALPSLVLDSRPLVAEDPFLF